MACKTLIVGVGSKGSDMASRVVERIFERHGSLKNAPWVRVLAIDTAPISSEPGHEAWMMAATKNVANIGLDGKQYSSFVDGSDTLGSMDYKRWADTSLFAQSGASTKGANGVRMIGRGSFLHPASLLQVHTDLKKRLDELTKVNLQEELAKRHLPSLPEGDTGEVIRIFVTGSLTGGTSSGCFIDVGYFLQAMGGFKSYEVLGVFAIPHPACGNPSAMSNAYNALRELNHFLSDGVRYRQRVPLPAYFPTPIEPPLGTAPFRGTMLVMARSGVAEEIPPMHESVAEFIYSSACSNIADSTFQKIVDPAAQYHNLIVEGVHARFQTFGSATLVFPSAHIARGASCRLASEAISEWLAKPELPVADGLAELTRKEFTLDRLREEFTRPAQGKTPLRSAIESRIDTAVEQAIVDHLDYRQTAESQIEDGFVTHGVVDNSIGSLIVHQTIEANAPILKEKWIGSFKSDIDRSVLDLGRSLKIVGSDIDRGPNYAIGYCKAILRRIEDIRKETQSATQHGAVSSAREACDEKWSELQKANSMLAKRLAWARGGRSIVAPEWGESAKAYWKARVDDECGFAIAELLGIIEGFVIRTLSRLHGSVDGDGKSGHNPHCLIDIAKDIQALAEAEYAKLDSAAPKLNGKSIFTPGQTIDKEHKDAMKAIVDFDRDGTVKIDPSRTDEEYARAWIIRAWELLASTPTSSDSKELIYWVTTDENSPFDPPTNLGTAEATAQSKAKSAHVHLDRMLTPTRRRFYDALFKRDVLEEVYGHADQKNPGADETIQGVISQAEPFLAIHDGLPLGQPGPQDSRTPSFAFFVNAKAEIPPYSSFAEALEVAHIPEGNLIPSDDPTRATVLRTRTTFPVVAVEGVIRGDQNYAHFEAQMLAANGSRRSDGRSPFESRKDVAWRTLDGSPIHPRIEHGMGLFLFGLAISAIKPQNGEYEVQTNDPGRRLEADLEKAGLSLCLNLTVSAYLEHYLQQWAKPHSAPQLADKVHDLVQGFAVKFANIEYRGRLASYGELRDEIETLLMQFLDRNAFQALVKYDQYVVDHEPKPDKYWLDAGALRHIDKKSLPEGYYCRNELCQTYLGARHEEAALPMECPQCKSPLFKPGWQRRWNGGNPIGQIAHTQPDGPDLPSPTAYPSDSAGPTAPTFTSSIIDNV